MHIHIKNLENKEKPKKETEITPDPTAAKYSYLKLPVPNHFFFFENLGHFLTVLLFEYHTLASVITILTDSLYVTFRNSLIKETKLKFLPKSPSFPDFHFPLMLC